MKKDKQRYEKYWQARLSKNDFELHERVFPNEILETLVGNLKSGKGRLLDIGCGNGKLMEAVKEYFDEICGCDISITAISQVKLKGFNSVCVDLDDDYLPFENTSFDTVTISEVIEHVIDPLRLLRELHRILANRGKILITTPNIRYIKNLLTLIFKGIFPHTSADTSIWGGGHLHYFTRKDLLFLLKQANFSSITFHLNRNQFSRSWKRNLLHSITGDYLFEEWFCGGIIVEAFKP